MPAGRSTASGTNRDRRHRYVGDGGAVEGFAAAVLSAARRLAGLSRTMCELARVARSSPHELQDAYDAMNRILGLASGPIDPGEYPPRFSSGLDVPAAVERPSVGVRRDVFTEPCEVDRLPSPAIEGGYSVEDARTQRALTET